MYISSQNVTKNQKILFFIKIPTKAITMKNEAYIFGLYCHFNFLNANTDGYEWFCWW